MTKDTNVTWTVTYRDDNGEPTAPEFIAARIRTRAEAVQIASSYWRAGKAILKIVGSNGSVISASEYKACVPVGMASSSVGA
jgi:hypothetical protein